MTESAFPYAYFDKQLNQTRTMYGMNLRDYFAAAALPMAIKEMNEAESFNINDAAIVAYQYADAMMKARQSND
jgi:hypothetical protein